VPQLILSMIKECDTVMTDEGRLKAATLHLDTNHLKKPHDRRAAAYPANQIGFSQNIFRQKRKKIVLKNEQRANGYYNYGEKNCAEK